MKPNQMNTIENIEPTVKVLPLQTKTESILARMNADYESKRTKIRNKISLERRNIYALDVLRTQHKSNIQKLQEEEDNLRVKWMNDKARILEETEYNRGKDEVFATHPNENGVVSTHPLKLTQGVTTINDDDATIEKAMDILHKRLYLQSFGSKNVNIFTLEEFLEKFPYKVGDEVQHSRGIGMITSMRWDDMNSEMLYNVCVNNETWLTSVNFLEHCKNKKKQR